jgi:hypothetical protein
VYIRLMDNIVGSLTEEQKSIIIGKLLGDGSLRKKATTLLEINHSHIQKEYVLWLYEKFRFLTLTPPKLRVSGKNRFSFRFTTISTSLFNEYYSAFYSKGTKKVPKDIQLDPLSIAVWFMDDGSKDRDSIYLNTQQFSVEDQYLLLAKLRVFGLEGNINKDKTYYRIRLYKKSYKTFRSLVEEHVIDSMQYKLLL